MAIALDPKRRVEHTLKGDDGSTVFTLRALTSRQRAEVDDALVTVEGGEQAYRIGSTRRLRLRYGLLAWRGFKFADGSEAPFETGRDGFPTDATLDLLDDAAVAELSDAIASLSTLSKADQD